MAPSTSTAARTRRGLSQHVRGWDATEPWGSVLIVHGLAEHSGRYEHVGAALAGAGLSVRAPDLTGFGQSGGRRAFVPGIDVWLDDLADRLAELPADRPRILLGHSMGGLVSTAYVLSDRLRPDALVLSAPALGSAVPRWKQVAAGVVGRVTPALEIPNDFRGEWLSRDPAVGEAYLSDPLVQQKTTARLGQVLLDAMAATRAAVHALDLPTLVVHGDADGLVPAAFSEVLEGCPSVTRRVYPDLRHELFNEPEGPQVIGHVVEWLRAAVGAGAAP